MNIKINAKIEIKEVKVSISKDYTCSAVVEGRITDAASHSSNHIALHIPLSEKLRNAIWEECKKGAKIKAEGNLIGW